MEKQDVIHKEERKTDASETITDLGRNAAIEISSALRPLLLSGRALRPWR